MNFTEAFEESDWAVLITHVLDLPSHRTDLDGLVTKGEWRSVMGYIQSRKPCLLFKEGCLIGRIQTIPTGLPFAHTTDVVTMGAEGHLKGILTNESGELLEAFLLPDPSSADKDVSEQKRGVSLSVLADEDFSEFEEELTKVMDQLMADIETLSASSGQSRGLRFVGWFIRG